MIFNEKEKQLLIETICNEQHRIIVSNDMDYESDNYKMLEELKAKIREM